MKNVPVLAHNRRDGDDVIDGGAGNDVARFSGNRSRYTIVAENGGYRITDSLSGGDGNGDDDP